MKIKHTYLTLFQVSETGLELKGDFVTEVEAVEYADAEGIDSYCVILTTVVETVEDKRTSQSPRSITQRGSSAAAEEDTLEERAKGPVKNSRKR